MKNITRTQVDLSTRLADSAANLINALSNDATNGHLCQDCRTAMSNLARKLCDESLAVLNKGDAE